MLMHKEREKLVEYGKKLVRSGLTRGTGGNLSLVGADRENMAVTPSGVEYEAMTPEDIVITDMSGRVVDGARTPSSEAGFHAAVYAARPDVTAVVHAHSPFATTVACLNRELPAVHYLVGFAGDKVPLAPYHTYGTPELAEAVGRAVDGYNAVLLANHGLVTCGVNMMKAFECAEEIEFVAEVYIRALSVGEPVVLSSEEMQVVCEKFKGYGQRS